MNHRSCQRHSPPSLPRFDRSSQPEVQHIALAHQPAVQFHLVPGAESGERFEQTFVQFTRVFFLKQADEASFVLDDASQVHDIGWPVEVPVGKGQDHANVNAVVLAHPFIVHRYEHPSLPRNPLVDRAVIVRCPVFSMLNEFLFRIDFKGARPVLLFNHQQGVTAHDDEVNFSLSPLFSIGDANRFKHVPAVSFPSGSTDFCEPLFGQLASAMDFIRRMETPPFPPPRPACAKFHAFTEGVRPRC